MSRASGADADTLDDRVHDALLAAHAPTRARFSAAAVQAANNISTNRALQAAEATFDSIWMTPENRVVIADAAVVLQLLNDWLAREGYRTLTPLSLARAMRPADLATDLFTTLMYIDDCSVT
jgi:hypothetical protein